MASADLELTFKKGFNEGIEIALSKEVIPENTTGDDIFYYALQAGYNHVLKQVEDSTELAEKKWWQLWK